MKILIVTDTLPFPPLNGKELPIAGLFEIISKTNETDILLLADKSKVAKDISAIPSTVNYIGTSTIKKNSEKERVVKSILTLKHTISSFEFSAVELKNLIKKDYDFIWISPSHYYSFITFCTQNNFRFFKKSAIGLNDSKTYQYRDSMNALINSRIFKWRYVTEWLRSFLLKAEERNFLSLADLVHVQTEDEAHKVRKVLGSSSKVKIVAAQNGIKKELFDCSYKGIDSNTILYMTHLHGHRKKESEWFIKKVWKIIKSELPDVKLLIVGTPQKGPIDYIDNDERIIVEGYVGDVNLLYNSIRLAVVPTFHGTGLINRILDALAAGVPVVSTPQAIATFLNLKIGQEISAGTTPQSFADAVIKLYNDKQYRQSVAANGKKFALTQNKWEKSAGIVEKAMKEIL